MKINKEILEYIKLLQSQSFKGIAKAMSIQWS